MRSMNTVIRQKFSIQINGLRFGIDTQTVTKNNKLTCPPLVAAPVRGGQVRTVLSFPAKRFCSLRHKRYRVDNDEAVTHTTLSGALTSRHSSRKFGVYDNPQDLSF